MALLLVPTHAIACCHAQPAGTTTPLGVTVSGGCIFGEDSHGALCGAADMGWAAEAGIVLAVLPADSCVGSAPPRDPPAVSCW